MMQGSTICGSIQTSPLTSDEIHVAQVLLDITAMIRNLEPGSGLKWGTKKRRSRLDDHKTDIGVQHTSPQPKAAVSAAASPVTPLAFFPSESDEQRSKHPLKKTPKKMSRGAYMEMIEKLSQRRDMLRGEIVNVTNYYNKLIAQNSQLKAMKQEVIIASSDSPSKKDINCWPRKEEGESGRSMGGNLATKLIPRNNERSVESKSRPQAVVEVDENFHSSFGFGLFNGLVGPFWIPDLKEEMGPHQAVGRIIADDKRIRFAEARRRRMDILRVKSTTSFKLPRSR